MRKKSQFLGVSWENKWPKIKISLFGQWQFSKVFRNIVCMNSCSINLVHWWYLEICDRKDECYLRVDRFDFRPSSGGGVGCKKWYHAATIKRRLIKIAPITLKEVVIYTKNSFAKKTKKCVSSTGPTPLFFCSTSGSINNTKSNFSKNFFFSFAHIENTQKSAFLMFLLDEHTRCFENFEKRS